MPNYACDRCGVVRDNAESVCPVCGNDSYSEASFPEPADEPEEEPEPEEEDGEEYPCPDCEESFDTPQGLASHSRVHGEDETGNSG